MKKGLLAKNLITRDTKNPTGDVMDKKNWKRSLFVEKYGCKRCPYRGKSECPYGIGVNEYDKDQYDAFGKLLHKKGDKVKSHSLGICQERLFMMQQYYAMLGTADGLKMARAEKLIPLSDTLDELNYKLRELMDNEDILIKDLETGDTKLISAVQDIVKMSGSYVDLINKSLAIEERKGDASSMQTINADALHKIVQDSRELKRLPVKDE